MHDRNQEGKPFERRVFLRSGVIFTGAVLASSALLRDAGTKNKDEEKETEVGPPEDLMREHGVFEARAFSLRAKCCVVSIQKPNFSARNAG